MKAVVAATATCCAIHLGVIGVLAGWLVLPTSAAATVVAAVAVGGVVVARRATRRPESCARRLERSES